MNHDVNLRITERDVAERWGVSVSTVRRIRERGEIKALRIGRQVRFRIADVEEYEERSTAA